MDQAQDRRRGDGEIRERLVLVEAAMAEIPGIRARVHDMAQHVHMLVGAVDDAGDARREMAQKIDGLADEVKAGILASARTEAALGATMAAHIERCKADKAENKSLITSQGERQEKMHADNQAALEQTNGRLARLEIRMAGYIGAAAAVTWLLTNGATLIAKIIK